MRTRVSIRSQCTILDFCGHLGDRDAPAVQRAIREQLDARPGALICDLRAVPALGPVAAAVIATAGARPGSPARLVVVCNARPAIAEVLVRHGAAAAARVCHTLDDALLYVGARLPAARDPDAGVSWPPRRRDALTWPQPAPAGEGLLRITPTFQPLGLRLEGEVDITNTNLLATALARTTAAGRDVRLDLSGVVSIDLEGLRLLARTAAGLPRDRSLLLDPVPHHLRQVLSMSGWDQTPSLLLDAALR